MALIDIYATDAVTITPKGTLQGNGTYAAGTAVATKGRVQDRVGMVKTRDGREIMYTRVVWLKTDETVSIGDTVLAAGHSDEVLAVEKRDDLNGAQHYIKVYLGGA